jgi:hypothetical protein
LVFFVFVFRWGGARSFSQAHSWLLQFLVPFPKLDTFPCLAFRSRVIAVVVLVFFQPPSPMTSSRAILLVAITLAVSNHLASARQYAVKTDWTGDTCTPGSGNGLYTSEAYPTGSCLANYLKFDCNATHVRQWGCILNETVCDCTIAYGPLKEPFSVFARSIGRN